MASIDIKISDIKNTINFFDSIEIYRSKTGEFGPFVLYDTVFLRSDKNKYTIYDSLNKDNIWYKTRFSCSGSIDGHPCTAGVSTDLSDPFTGNYNDFILSPFYPDEVTLNEEDLKVVKKLRHTIGDTVALKREFGDDVIASIHPDGKTYEMKAKGWPVNIIVGGDCYTCRDNPYVDDYRYLVFNDTVFTTLTVSGVEYNIDIWYKTFRHSDKEILEAYDNCMLPPYLTEQNANSEVYMLQTAVDLIMSEGFNDAIEDGASVSTDGSSYSPGAGYSVREQLLDRLQQRLDSLVKMLMFRNQRGIRID